MSALNMSSMALGPLVILNSSEALLAFQKRGHSSICLGWKKTGMQPSEMASVMAWRTIVSPGGMKQNRDFT